jgi:hypothetical protein
LFSSCRSAGRNDLLTHYTRGCQVHWNGFSSASPKREVALQFARSGGPGGVLLKLDLLAVKSRSRDIRSLSALTAEDEARAAQPPQTQAFMLLPLAPASSLIHLPLTASACSVCQCLDLLIATRSEAQNKLFRIYPCIERMYISSFYKHVNACIYLHFTP